MRLLFILLMIPAAMHAQNKGAFVSVITSHDRPLVENTWTFTLYVDYPDPEAVSVIAPSFDGALFLERVVKYPRVTGNKIQTAVEYRFIPARSGRYTLEKFTVICPDGVTETSPYILDITANDEGQKPGQKPIIMRFNWEIEPLQRDTAAQITAGEKVILTLRAIDKDSWLPPAEFFLPEVPKDAVLSLSQISEEERKNGAAAKITLIPLAAGIFRLDARTLQHENISFYIPALQINVNPVSAQNTPQINSQNIYVPARADDVPTEQMSTEYSHDNANFLQRFLPALSLFIFILVIITPFICLVLFKREK